MVEADEMRMSKNEKGKGEGKYFGGVVDFGWLVWWCEFEQ